MIYIAITWDGTVIKATTSKKVAKKWKEDRSIVVEYKDEKS